MSYSVYEWFDDFISKSNNLEELLERIKKLSYTDTAERNLKSFINLCINAASEGLLEQSYTNTIVDLVYENYGYNDATIRACLITKGYNSLTLSGDLELFDERWKLKEI